MRENIEQPNCPNFGDTSQRTRFSFTPPMSLGRPALLRYLEMARNKEGRGYQLSTYVRSNSGPSSLLYRRLQQLLLLRNATALMDAMNSPKFLLLRTCGVCSCEPQHPALQRTLATFTAKETNKQHSHYRPSVAFTLGPLKFLSLHTSTA